MVIAFTITIFLLFFLISILLKNNIQIKKNHVRNIKQLQANIYSLNLKHKKLNEKLNISNNFDASIKNDFKIIGAEIVSLQEFFLKIISEKK